ncbi:MAG TPA: nitrite/sulfite reductase [Dehalococcoidia bacterium]|nr:nitrite/sulfite reductase [Dehalococcoidia bacterium]
MTTEAVRNEIIPVDYAEIDEFAGRVLAFRNEQEDPTEFTRYRLRQGVYGQRQDDAQMMRVKIPGGIVSAEQLEGLGAIARYAPLSKGHITTRENVQFHHLKLEGAEEAMRILGPVGLTSREACGNTVRNVITNPSAGVDPTEVFDTTPYLIAYVRYFVRKPFTQDMPRKFKTSFSSTPTDDAVAPFHDLGFVAVRRGGQIGFRMHVGGGSSIMPREALPLYEFVLVSEYLRVSEAILRVFNASDELRKNRMMARIKVLVDRIGMDAFREKVEEELKQPWAAEPIDPSPYIDFDYEPVRPEIDEALSAPEDGPEVYRTWLASNVQPQRQRGYAMVEVTVPQGDLNPDQFDALAKLSRRFGNGRSQLSAEQNLLFRWVRLDEVLDLWNELDAIGLSLPGANEITDVVCCPGTDSCKLGITASMGLNRAMRSAIAELPLIDPAVRDLHIKISGCPNGCGRHHLANIGFQGAAVKDKDGKQVPAYEVYVGGEFEKGTFRFAKRIAEKIPSKRAPEAMKRMVQFYLDGRQGDERFNDFVDRVGPKSFSTVLQDLKEVAGLSVETFDDYFDWERTTPYKLERGEGECAV